MFVTRLTFTIFACIILMCLHVILIVCKMTCESEWTMCKYGAHEYQVKIELYHIS